MKEIISTSKAPAAIGPYSQAVKAGGMLYISGQLPIDPSTGEFAAPDIAVQTRQSLENLKAILFRLAAAWMTWSKLRSCWQTSVISEL